MTEAPQADREKLTLDNLIAAALATDEIQTALADQRLGLTEDELRAHALTRPDLIDEALAAEVRRSEARRAELAAARVRLRGIWRTWPWWRTIRATDRRLREFESEMRTTVTRVAQEGVLPVLRALINERLAPLVWANFDIQEAPGLDRVRDSRFVVRTGSAQRFLDLAGQVRSGAIGVAGVRGVGKSTVIEYYQGLDREAVSVLVSAPVQYNAREFVLHLYARLCTEVLSRLGGRARVLRDLTRTTMSAVARFSVAAVLALGIGVQVVGPTRLFAVTHWPVAGWVLLILGLGCAGYVLFLLGALLLTRWPPRTIWRWLTTVDRTPTGAQFLVGQARQRLARIRFLQTRTTGWSGKLTGPNSEVGFERSTERAEQPLTYPEIVHELRGFIAMVAAGRYSDPGVIVAVDELDKIEDAEQAQQFVNEIKGVFGVPGAQFLVSVSEDALASFERRGLPVRDAFDSAFDEIVRIEPLNLDDACTLLRSRVIGVSDLFSALAHCMAGGLARDIIRTARSMRAVAAADTGIETVCRDLIQADIQRKIHAFQQATGQLEGTPDTTDFIRALRVLHADRAAIEAELPALSPKDDDRADFRQVRFQARTYAYHCATVLAVFTAELTSERFADQRTELDKLAAAKQELGARPQLAWLMLDEFRAAWGLPTVPMASTPTGATGTPDGRPSR